MDDELKRMQAESARLLDEAEDAAEAESDDAQAVGGVGERESSEFDAAYASVEEGAGVSGEGVGSSLDEGVDGIDESVAHGGPTADAENRDIGDRAVTEGEQAGSDHNSQAGKVDEPAAHSQMAAMRRQMRAYKRNLKGAEKAQQKIREENEALRRRLESVGEEYTPPPEGFDPSMVDKLRSDYGDDIANVVESLARSAGVYQAASADVPDGDGSGEAGGGVAPAPATFDELLDAADDSAPIQQLGIWMDSANPRDVAMFNRAKAIESQLGQDPAFASVDPVSFYNEVVRRTQGTAESSFIENNANAMGAVPSGAGGAGRSAVPASLSDAPGQVAPVGSAVEQVMGMSPKELIAWRKDATPEAQKALDDALWG